MSFSSFLFHMPTESDLRISIEKQQIEIQRLHQRIEELEKLFSDGIVGAHARMDRMTEQINLIQGSQPISDIWMRRLDQVDKLFLRRLNDPLKMSEVCFKIKYGKSDKRYREATRLRQKLEQFPERYRIHSRKRGNTTDLVPEYYNHLKKDDLKKKKGLVEWDSD